MGTRALPRFSRPGKPAVILLSVCLIAGLCATGYLKLRSYVIARFLATPVRPTVVLKNQPAWMSDYLAQSIIDSVRPSAPSSPFDKQVLIAAYNALSANPWVKNVREIHRMYGKAPGDRLEIDCTYRTPTALVSHDGQYILIADDRTVLPETFAEAELPKVMFATDAQGQIHTRLRIIQGTNTIPPKPGAIWTGPDINAGLQMAALLSQVPYADDIVRIDVSNAGGAIGQHLPRLILLTKAGTQIRWGQAPGQDDFAEATPATKLSHLQQIYAQYHRLDANEPWLDLRFDHVIYPTVQASIASPE